MQTVCHCKLILIIYFFCTLYTANINKTKKTKKTKKTNLTKQNKYQEKKHITILFHSKSTTTMNTLTLHRVCKMMKKTDTSHQTRRVTSALLHTNKKHCQHKTKHNISNVICCNGKHTMRNVVYKRANKLFNRKT